MHILRVGLGEGGRQCDLEKDNSWDILTGDVTKWRHTKRAVPVPIEFAHAEFLKGLQPSKVAKEWRNIPFSRLVLSFLEAKFLILMWNWYYTRRSNFIIRFAFSQNLVRAKKYFAQNLENFCTAAKISLLRPSAAPRLRCVILGMALMVIHICRGQAILCKEIEEHQMIKIIFQFIIFSK